MTELFKNSALEDALAPSMRSLRWGGLLQSGAFSTLIALCRLGGVRDALLHPRCMVDAWGMHGKRNPG